MPTLVYLVHGIGAGTADGAERPADARWSTSVIDACRWVCKTYGLPEPTVVDPLADELPADAEDPSAVWLVPVSYYHAFDEFRVSAADRDEAVRGLKLPNVGDAELTKLASKEFLWVNALDVLLWWADEVQARNIATTRILNAITHVDDLLLRDAPGADTRRILVSHSLGTAATTFALAEHLAKEEAWRRRGAFEAWFTLANVAPFVTPLTTTYSDALVPRAPRSLITGAMYNARQEFDPIPRLMPWRMFAPDSAASGPAWARSVALGDYTLIPTRGVTALPNGTPSIGDVHGFANYLVFPDVARRLAGHVRGEMFSDDELTDLDPVAAWRALPALRCTRNPGTLGELGMAVQDFVQHAPLPVVSNDPPDVWVPQLLRGAELIASAKERC